jgi:diadenosine tetraphosphate (Ap4A) HIT family hydrolase
MTFILDHRLEQSSFFIADWDLCRVALRNEKTWPWLYLVPRRADIRETYELTPDDQAHLMHEISRAARALQFVYKPEKINVAALGNMVPQLHVHVFARFTDDPAWPKPVWALQRDEVPYDNSEKQTQIEKLKECFDRMQGRGE